MKLIKYCLITIIKSILWCLDSDHRTHDTIGDDNVKKFTHVESTDFESDFGKTTRVVRTIPYSMWELKTTTKTLRGADRHLVIRETREPVWIENLCVGDMILTQDGPEEVLSARSLGIKTHMYCMQVETESSDDPNNHLFYSNGILSHNTTTASAYLLWHAMFKSDQTILVVANVFRAATEIMHRIRTMYESCPDHIRAGVKAFNKTSIEFDNGSRIVSQATTPNSGRGLSVSLLYCFSPETTISLKHKITDETKSISFDALSSDDVFTENTEWDIDTPYGWCHFAGIYKKGVAPVVKIITTTGEVTATQDHTFYHHGEKVLVKDLVIGQEFGNGVITDLIPMSETVVYDVIEVGNQEHSFIVNNQFITKNCDEMAFCAPNIIEDMWTSLSPTLAATKGKSIITSTPKTDVDIFARLWKGANDNTDEFGNHDPRCKNGEGKNGFYPVIATWDKNPTRTKEWAEAEEAKIGKAKFAQEHNCIIGQSLVNIEGIGSISIEDLYKMLGGQL